MVKPKYINKMKTLQEIKAHFHNNAYNKDEMNKICGWLIAKGIKEPNDKIRYQVGKGTLEDFLKWYNAKPIDLKNIVGKIFKSNHIYVICLSEVKNGYFVGYGDSLGLYEIDKCELCNEDEIDFVENTMMKNGFMMTKDGKFIVLSDYKKKKDLDKDYERVAIAKALEELFGF